MIAHERGEWDEAARIATELPVPADALPVAYADSLKWARELSQVAGRRWQAARARLRLQARRT